MKRTLVCALTSMIFAGCAFADITVKVNPEVNQKDFQVRYGYIDDMVKPRMLRPDAKVDTKSADGGQFTISTLPDGAAQYYIPVGEEMIRVFTMPSDDITINIESATPLSYNASGSRLMEDVASLDMQSSNILREFQLAASVGEIDDETSAAFEKKYYDVFKNFLTSDSDSPAVPFAILMLEGQDFLNAYDAMTPAAKESPIAALLEPQKQYVERKIEADKRMKLLQSGEVEAPDFTFNNADGKPVSLSDFRGKWVVIDFWGTWCPWCIKGFPELKKAYEELKPKLEVLGVACNDKYDAWLNGLKKYELPWVNVYNPENGDGKVLEDYAVEGFPTKVIVSPEGKIANITVGEDPAFFTVLRDLVK